MLATWAALAPAFAAGRCTVRRLRLFFLAFHMLRDAHFLREASFSTRGTAGGVPFASRCAEMPSRLIIRSAVLGVHLAWRFLWPAATWSLYTSLSGNCISGIDSCLLPQTRCFARTHVKGTAQITVVVYSSFLDSRFCIWSPRWVQERYPVSLHQIHFRTHFRHHSHAFRSSLEGPVCGM